MTNQSVSEWASEHERERERFRLFFGMVPIHHHKTPITLPHEFQRPDFVLLLPLAEFSPCASDRFLILKAGKMFECLLLFISRLLIWLLTQTISHVWKVCIYCQIPVTIVIKKCTHWMHGIMADATPGCVCFHGSRCTIMAELHYWKMYTYS